MNKYYTPEIEEFCVGFRFEQYKNKPTNKMIYLPKAWIPTTFNTSTSLSTITRLLLRKTEAVGSTVRVKHLDQEDIEELGWKLGAGGEYEKGDRWYLWKTETGDWEIGDDENEKGFRGEIKNYNELKKLMNQLGI